MMSCKNSPALLIFEYTWIGVFAETLGIVRDSNRMTVASEARLETEMIFREKA